MQTLRKAAEEMRRGEDERRERYEASITALYHRERDIALAAYNGDAAAEQLWLSPRIFIAANAAKIEHFLSSEAHALEGYSAIDAGAMCISSLRLPCAANY